MTLAEVSHLGSVGPLGFGPLHFGSADFRLALRLRSFGIHTVYLQESREALRKIPEHSGLWNKDYTDSTRNPSERLTFVVPVGKGVLLPNLTAEAQDLLAQAERLVEDLHGEHGSPCADDAQ